jgi:ribonuclease T2
MSYLFNGEVIKILFLDTLCLNSSQCKDVIKSIPKNSFTLHGLWPSNSSGKNNPVCSTGEEITIRDDGSEIFDHMEKKWISYTSPNEKFWTHEYNKHGLCFMKKYNKQSFKEYFKFALEVFNRHNLDNIMLNAFDAEVSGERSFGVNELISKLQSVLGGLIFELDCKNYNGKQHLQEIRFYFDIDFEPFSFYPKRTDCNANKPIYVVFQ